MKNVKKTSAEWLKTEGYSSTNKQDAINYFFCLLKKTEENKIPADAGHFIRSEIEATDLKKIRASYKNNS